MGVDYTLSLRPIDYSLWTSSPVRSLAADYPLTFWGHVFILFVITIQWALPHLLHSSFRQSRGRTGFRSFPQFTIVQLVLISSFLPKKIWISKIYFKSFMLLKKNPSSSRQTSTSELSNCLSESSKTAREFIPDLLCFIFFDIWLV